MDELKELVARELNSNGILNKLQAQLRAHIYTTLATHIATNHHPSQPPLPTALPPAFHTSIEGSLVLSMFQEYCHFHHLYNTLSVLQLETSQPRPAPAVDRLAIARSLHISSSSAAASHHSLAYELYLLSHTSRPSSPLVSPRSEPHPLPLSHHMSSPNKSTHEDLTPPALSPSRLLLSQRDREKEEDDVRRLREVEAQLAAMRAGKSTNGGGGDGSEEYSEDWTGVTLDGGSGGGMDDVIDVYAGDEAVLDGEKWAKRYDYVEAVQHAR